MSDCKHLIFFILAYCWFAVLIELIYSFRLCPSKKNVFVQTFNSFNVFAVCSGRRVVLRTKFSKQCRCSLWQLKLGCLVFFVFLLIGSVQNCLVVTFPGSLVVVYGWFLFPSSSVPSSYLKNNCCWNTRSKYVDSGLTI